jgi:hypothetical protein
MVLFATSSRRQSRGVGRCVTLANGQQHTAAPNVWAAFLLHHAEGGSVMTDETRWDENAGLRRDAISSQVIDALEAQGDKETGNEED